MIQSCTELGRGGLRGHGRVYSNLPYIFFFNKGFGNVKGIMYLCIVMLSTVYSLDNITPKLKQNRKFVKRLNDVMSREDMTVQTASNKVVGTPKMGFVTKRNIMEVKITFHIKEGYIMYYGNKEYTKINKSHSQSRRLALRIKDYVKNEVYEKYLKLLGLRRYNVTISMSWV